MMQHGNSDYPFLLGHEGIGIIEKVGTSIKEYSIGDHVVISYTSCGHCDACCEKRPYQCKYIYDPFFFEFREDGTTSVSYQNKSVPTFISQGSIAEYAIVHKSSLVKVDNSLDLRVLAPL